MAMLESEMEDLLIKQLTCDVSQWTYRPDLTTEDALWNNLREKLNRNNIDKLQGVPLTDGEMNPGQAVPVGSGCYDLQGCSLAVG